MARKLPLSYLTVAGVLVLVAAYTTLVFLGVPPFDNLAVFVVTQFVGFVLLLVLGVVGGAFVGMLLAHRILANRQFTPFERTVLEGLEEIRARLDRLEKEIERPDEAQGKLRR